MKNQITILALSILITSLSAPFARSAERKAGSPGGHFKFPHLWPGQIPPPTVVETLNSYAS